MVIDSNTLSGSAAYSLSLWTFALGALVALLIIFFALALLYARQVGWWRRHHMPQDILIAEFFSYMRDSTRRKEALAIGAAAATLYGEYLSRRNEFWLTYGQITVAVLLLIVVTVLLLTKTINPDAGLPILSGIAGFALAKGSGAGRGTSVIKPPEGGEEG